MARVLVVDDDETIREVLSHKLAQMGHDVTAAADGDAGLATARDGRFDLVLLDRSMPRMSGLEVCRALRDDGDDVPIILLTGRVLEDDVEAGFAAGADDYLAKPVSLRDLAHRVRAHVRPGLPSRRGADQRAPVKRSNT